MPSGTSIQQLVEDLRDRKSTIARKFDECNGNCQGNGDYRGEIYDLVNNWDTAQSLPGGLVTKLNLTKDEVAHIDAWPDKANVKDAIVEALKPDHVTPREMEFFWDLNDNPGANVSKADIDGLGGAGKITVTFLTPRAKVTKKFTTFFGNVNVGGVDLEV
jgi:hypothetical protein